MSATDPSEAVPACTEYAHDGYLVDDSIDLSDLQLDDNEDWLYIPPQCSTESAVHDLYGWLKTEPEVDVTNHKKYIDTRTFTRPKKRSARMSFESIFEGLASSLKNTCKLGSIDIRTEHEKKYSPEVIRDCDFVPPMLKPSAKLPMNILSEENSVISGQESMEAFLNMSQSNGIDSFINLREPEFSDVLWNTSQPSLFYASLISSTNEILSISDTTSVTDKSTAQKSSDVEKESSSSSGNETILIRDNDDTITPNKINRTKSPSIQPGRGLSETYNTETLDKVLSARSSLEKEKTAALSSTFVTEPNIGLTFVHQPDEAGDNIKHLDVTYLSSAKNAEKSNSPISRNDTYELDSVAHVNKADLNVTCNILTDERESMPLFEAHAAENVLDMTFHVPDSNRSTPIHPNMNVTSSLAAKHPDQPRQTLCPTLKAPTSLRRELLAEIQRSERNQDSAYNRIVNDHLGSKDTKENIHVASNRDKTDVALSNRYHTYRKSALTAMANQYRGQRDTAVTAQKDLPVDQRKFYTFTKKSNNPVEKTDNTAISNAVETQSANLDGTFCKPLPPKKQQQKRILSKLPQFLQKSNPNLVSGSLRAVGGVPGTYASISSVGYMKGSQPDIVQNVTKNMQLPSNLHPYGKSGSEQRLLEVNVNANHQFPMKSITAGSTESIESIQSAQSAPDLDDRHSTCSDSSHNSCVKGTMNIEELRNLVRMQEESLKQDLPPKPNRRILENTWVEEKIDLLSPILKNGVEHEIDRLASDTDLNMKCSSPIDPTESHHTLSNTEGNPDGNVIKTKDNVTITEKTENPNQVVPKIETKTRLRQPASWNTGNKPAAVISGIPRPASRIPALRFARPNAKAQADLRKGCS